MEGIAVLLTGMILCKRRGMTEEGKVLVNE